MIRRPLFLAAPPLALLLAPLVSCLVSCNRPSKDAPAAAASTSATDTHTPPATDTPSASSGQSEPPSPSSRPLAAASASAPRPSTPHAPPTPSTSPSTASPSTASPSTASTAKPVATHLAADHYAVDFTAPSDCRASVECTATVRLVALGEYHVNDEYPYKFLATADQQVQFLGTDAAGAGVFSRAAGDFRAETRTVGTLAVRFKPAASGRVTLSGTFKMSVCSEANCQVEQPKISLVVPVL